MEPFLEYHVETNSPLCSAAGHDGPTSTEGGRMNQPPQTDKQTGKGIVSKGAYVKVRSNKAAKGIVGILLWLTAIGAGVLSLLPLYGFLYFLLKWDFLALVCLCLFVFIGGGTYYVAKVASEIMIDSVKELEIVPLTRANTAHLPAPDSLVRASAEPVQEQQAVLLRAAIQGMETPPEQLVRPAEAGPVQGVYE
jgi:hypothetical protein